MNEQSAFQVARKMGNADGFPSPLWLIYKKNRELRRKRFKAIECNQLCWGFS
jgi:hypothetical protein